LLELMNAVPPLLRRSTLRGITLVELLVVVAVAAILAAIGIPAYQGLLAQNRVSAAANNLLAAMQQARSEAVRYSRTASVCPRATDATCADASGSNPWNNGWLVLADRGSGPVVVAVYAPVHPNVGAQAEATVPFDFGPLGNLSAPSVNSHIVFAYSSPVVARSVCVRATGAAKVVSGACA
jgi:prepilin-type N-terminal cleavage/methylation domain-containing protein